MPKSFKVKVKLAINEGKTLRKDENGMAELELPMEIPPEKQPLYTTNRITEEANDKRARVGEWLRRGGVKGITLMEGPIRSRLTPKEDAEKVIEERKVINAKGTKSVPQVGETLGVYEEKLRKHMKRYGIGRKIGKQLYKQNENYRTIANCMEHPEFRKLFDTYFSNIDDIKTILLFLKLYQKIEKTSTIQLNGYQKLSILDGIIKNRELRQKIFHEVHVNELLLN